MEKDEVTHRSEETGETDEESRATDEEKDDKVDDDSDEIKIFVDGEEDTITKNKAYFPEWNFDHVRPWVPLRRDDAYDNDQILQVAGHDLVMLEKANGFRTHGSVESGAFEAAKRIKNINPKVKVLFYLNAMIHYPHYEADLTFKKDQWAMRDPKTNDFYLWNKRFVSYDHRNLEFREWWITRALDMLQHDEIDGIFIDAIIKTAAVSNSIDAPDHDKAYIETANDLRARLPEGKLLIGNALRANAPKGAGGEGNIKHLKYLDGSYLENWDRSDEGIAKTIRLMRTALKAGRLIMFTSTPFSGYPLAKRYTEQQKEILATLKTMTADDKYPYIEQFIEFPLGVFLLAVEEFAYFSYHDSVDASPRTGNAAFDCNRYVEITRQLGNPLGPYEEEGEFIFTREFVNLKVWVDVQNKVGKLTVKEVRDEL
ncbi:hypothetical protein HJC23_010726 [Cyclotella cryptica]|uniref:Glycoside-hydrolase family GH114 TIM-barrel domain-containing protein n=1 Tax=Cyclotella cryptica TaxID=29204 RepID=A0ABD3PEP5_9STRA